MILNGVQHLVNRQHPQAIDQLDERALGAGWRMVEELRSLGRSQGVRVRSDVRTGAVVEEIVLGAARDDAVDLIVLGTDVRAGSGRLFLGPRVERILSTAPCPVLVINGV
jgi:nucleotide-binding universal stress UspA family protein